MRVCYNKARLAERYNINRVLKIALQYLDQPNNVLIQLSMVDSDTIHALNFRDRGVDRPTDVLSYPYLNIVAGDKVDSSSDIDMDSGLIMLGDIIICRSVAYEQADSYGHSKTREMCYLAVHSLLHLLGYDHTTEQEEQQMSAVANSIMIKAGINR